MQKSNLSISTNLLGFLLVALGFLTTFYTFSGLVLPLFIFVAYVFLKEYDLTLRCQAAVVSILTLTYQLVRVLFVYFIDEFLDFLNFFLQFAKITIRDEFGITNFLFLLISWTLKIIFVIVAFMALKGKTIGMKSLAKHLQ